jgi:phage protein D
MPDTPTTYATDPVFSVGGQRVADLARDCLALSVVEDTTGLRCCEAQFLANAPREQRSQDVVEYLDGRTIDFGSSLSVSLGPPDDEQVVFAGKVSALEVVFDEAEAPHVAVCAEDELMSLRMTRRSAAYSQVSDADIAEQIASQHGLRADVDAQGPTYDAVLQLDESDLGFLRKRAALIGAEVWVTGSTLHFATRDKRSGPSITLTPGRTLLTAALRADLAHQRSEVLVSGYDAQNRDVIDESASSSLVQAEVSGGRIGPDVLDQALGRSSDQWTGLTPMTTGEAHSWAGAQLLCRARRFVTVRGTTVGTPTMQVGARLRLDGVGAAFEGDGYYVTRVQQRWQRGAGGLRTHFEAERASIRSGGSGS